MIDVAAYLAVYRVPALGESYTAEPGGQELILGEVVGAIAPHSRIYLPFPSATLAHVLVLAGREVYYGAPDGVARWGGTRYPRADVLYFGTPTIVGDQPLFPQPTAEPLYEWTKAGERAAVRHMVAMAIEHRYARIVCGLGSGDISVDERLADLGGGEVVAHKKFRAPGSLPFEDWVLVRNLEL